MRHLALVLALLLAVGPTAHGDDSRPTPPAAAPEAVEISTLKTSIFIGSVTLTATPLLRDGATYAATYQARVSPWGLWSEHGAIAIAVPPPELEKLLRGETVELTGEARNHKGKTRRATARVQPTDAASGRIKVRIEAGGTTLIFNGTYRFTTPPPATATPPAPPPPG